MPRIARGVLAARAVREDPADVLGLELFEGDRLADLDRRPAPAAGRAARAATRSGRSARPTSGPSARIAARSMALRSSRRLPGQAYREQGLAGLRR